MAVVVVESPAKAKTINSYLGSGYKVLASYGHVRDLPSKDGSVDPDAGFEMRWEIDPKSQKHVRAIADYPQAGVTFRDITPLLGDAEAFRKAVDELAAPFEDLEVDRVVGVEARGFIPAAAVAYTIGAGFVPVRKAGKLPWAVAREEYDLEYGRDKLEIHRDAIHPDERILVIDGAMGELSLFHETFGYFAHGVAESTAILPEGWKDRLVKIENENTMGARGWCLEVHDLAVSKLAAGRDKDLIYVRALLRRRLADPAIIRRFPARP